MISVVISDDEKLIRAGLKKILIDSLDIPLNIFEAKNGEEALELCKNEQPELIITDIRMPKMDGIELMHNLSILENHPSIIVLSGFDDFSYAKAAIQNGASSYILKPVDKKELLNSVRAAISSFEKEEKRKNEDYLKSFLSGSDIANDVIPDGLNFQKGFYCVSFYGAKCFEIVEPMLLSFQFYCVERMKNSCCFVIPNEALSFIQNDITISTFIVGVSSLENNLGLLKQMIYKSKVAMLNAFFDKSTKEISVQKNNDVFYYSEIKHVEDFSNIEKKYEKYIARIDIYDVDLLQTKIKELFDFSNVESESIIEILDYIYRKITIDLFSRYKTYIESDMYLLIKQVMIINIYHANNLQEWIGYIFDFSIYLSNIIKKSKTEYPYIVQAIEYVKKHYTQNINMAIVANYVSINYTWFSEKFKEQVGVNFNDYLKKLRIEEAKRLLEIGCYKVYEVSSKSGFSDVKYFMKSFRENTGMSPTEWKKKFSIN